MPRLNLNHNSFLRLALLTCFALSLFCPNALAQVTTAEQSPVPIVTATAGSQRVRYSALGEVNETRLQVFSTDGAQVFDSAFKLGNLIDWTLSDQQGSRLLDGSYLFLVTVKEFNGALTQKYGMATIDSEQVRLQQTGRDELSAGQATALEANKLSSSLSAIDRVGATGLNRSQTAANDGGVVIDDVPSGKKTATSKPTTGGENITSTGTQNRVAKWTDNAGTLGNSSIFDNGNVGIGTTNPANVLDIVQDGGFAAITKISNSSSASAAQTLFWASSDTAQITLRAHASGRTLTRYGVTIGGYSEIGAESGNGLLIGTLSNANPIIFGTNGLERLRINPAGYVGIGTISPASKLDVAGAVNASQYKINGSPLLTASGNNTFTGSGAGAANTSGDNNSFYGYNAGLKNTTASGNSFFGYQAGLNNDQGANNAFFGASTGQANTTGAGNAFFGGSAGFKNDSGGSNTFIGPSAGGFNTSGSSNTFVGATAGLNNTMGGSNIALGSSAGSNLTTGDNNIEIGNSGVADESATIRIGTQGTQTQAFMAGISGNVLQSGVPVVIDTSTGQLGVAPVISSLRYKRDVRDMGSASSRLMNLRPVTFFYRPEVVKGEQTLQYGLIAEEVAKVYPELVQYGADGKAQSVRYNLLNTMLLNEMQKQQHLILSQEQRLKAQAEQNAAQSQRINNQAQQINELEMRLRRLEATVTRRHRTRRN